MSVTAYRSVVVGVSSLERSLHLFRDVMQLRVEREGAVPRELLDAWRVPSGITAREAELSCKGYPFGRLRLVEYTPTPQRHVRVDFGPDATDTPLDVGPKAIDFYVADPIGPWLERVVQAGCVARSVPRLHQIGHSISEEVVVSGPDALPILLMVGHRHRPTSLRAGSPDGPFSEIATTSVVGGDLTATRRFYGEGLGLVAVNDAETPDEYRDLVDDLVDAPRGTRVHFLLYAQPGEASGKILIVYFHGRSERRLVGRMRPGNLGVSLFCHETADLDALARRLSALGSTMGSTIVTPPTTVAMPTGVHRLMLVQGPNEELLEISQAP